MKKLLKEHKTEIVSITVFLFLTFILGLVDISGLDSRIVNRIFQVPNWDVNFYLLIGSIVIPGTVLFLGNKINEKYLQFGNKDKYILDAMQSIYGALLDTRNMANTVFSRLKKVPKDEEERKRYEANMLDSFASKFNRFQSVLNKNRIFIEDQSLLNDINIFSDLVYKLYDDYSYMKFFQDSDATSAYQEAFKDYNNSLQKFEKDGAESINNIEVKMRGYLKSLK